MLAVLTLLAMLSFVFLPTVMELMGTRGARGNPVVVKTAKYGPLNQRQLDQLLYRRQRLYAFFRQLAMAVQQKGGRGAAVSMALSAFGPSASEEAAVQDWLQTHKAEELGLKVSQKAINDYLVSLTEGKVGDSDVREILQRLRMTQGQLFESLRQEIMSIRLLQIFRDSLAATTPAQRWEYYQQLNRRAKIEAVPLAVSKFVDKVPNPTDEALRAFFAKYKDRLADPDSPEPGFREPHRVDIEYLKATVEPFMDPAAVSEQAIHEYYEANKERLYKDMLPEAPPLAAPKTELPKSEPPKAETQMPAGAAKEAPKAKPAKNEPAQPSTAKPAPAAAEPAKMAPAKTEPSKSEPPKAVPSKTVPPKGDAEKGKAASPAPDKKSSLVRRSPFRLVSEQKTVPASASKPEPPASRPAPPPAKTEAAAPKVAPSSPALSAPAPSAPAPAPKVEPEAKSPQPPAKQPSATPRIESMLGLSPAAGPSTTGPVKYKPLADVKDEIRKNLARQAAEEKIRDAIRRVQDKLNLYATKWTNYETADPEKKASMTPPARPDFVALAKENRLTAADTGLISALQMAGTDIGKSRVEGSASFVEVAYGKGTPMFLPGTSQDIEGNSYVYWKVDDSPERVPEFDEVRQQVLNAWKLVEAREPATKEAERLAAEARGAKKSLADLLAGKKDMQVLTPPPFTWLTYGNLPWYYRMSAPGLNEVAGIPGAKTDFMRTVFGLKPGETGVAADQSKSTVYVVRLVEYTPGDSVLWDMFVTDDYRSYMMAASDDQRNADRLWRERLQSDAGLRWEKEPSRGRGGDIED